MPLTLARMPRDAAYGVFEIGMNHPGEIRPLVKMVRPHVALITLIAAAHLGFFRNLDEIAAAKAEIFEGIEPDGTALINRDDPRSTGGSWAINSGGSAKSKSRTSIQRVSYRISSGRHLTAQIQMSKLSAHG